MSTPEYDDADRLRDGFHGDAGRLGQGTQDQLNRIFVTGTQDETGTADPATARGAARLVKDKGGSDETDAA